MTAPLSAQARLLAVIEALVGHEVVGMRLKEIVDALGLPVAATTILRDLETLEAAGWAQQTKEGRWTLASRPYQLLHHFYDGLKSIRDKAAEVATNYTRTPT
jgi:DNA-binding IclR family transcriptional regulator